MRDNFESGGLVLCDSEVEQNEFDSVEEYLPDDRMELRPSEVVQSKLIGILPRGMAIPVSCIHNRRDVRR